MIKRYLRLKKYLIAEINVQTWLKKQQPAIFFKDRAQFFIHTAYGIIIINILFCSSTYKKDVILDMFYQNSTNTASNTNLNA